MNRITAATMPLQAASSPERGLAMAAGLCETVRLTFKCPPTTDVFLFPSI